MLCTLTRFSAYFVLLQNETLHYQILDIMSDLFCLTVSTDITLKYLLNEYTLLDIILLFPPYSEVFPYTRLPFLKNNFHTRLLDHTQVQWINHFEWYVCSLCYKVINSLQTLHCIFSFWKLWCMKPSLIDLTFYETL